MSRRERSVSDDVEPLSKEQLDHLAQYFNEEVGIVSFLQTSSSSPRAPLTFRAEEGEQL
jgi:hypothetical protein